MVTRAAKIEAISRFGLMVGQNPWFSFFTGFLIGQVDRVNFVKDLANADIAVKISVRSTALWPHEPFKASVRGVSMPNPYVLVRSICDEDTPICVSLDFDHAEDTPWYQDVLLPDASFAKDAAATAQTEADALWKDMDRTLDIYRECKEMLKKDAGGRKKELAYYMRIAEEEMRKLSRQMEELNKQMKRISEQGV